MIEARGGHVQHRGTMRGNYSWSGGNTFSAADGPGGPLMAGDQPRRDRALSAKIAKNRNISYFSLRQKNN